MVELDGVQLFSKPVKSRKRRAADLLPELENKALHGQPATTSQQPLADGSLPEPKQAEQPLTPSEPVSADTDSTFKSLGLSEWLEKLCKSLGMAQPTQVQTGCIPSILAGRDVIGTAHTGSGKTAAFALPILQQLAQDPFGVYALVLTPTRCANSMHQCPVSGLNLLITCFAPMLCTEAGSPSQLSAAGLTCYSDAMTIMSISPHLQGRVCAAEN